MCVMTDFCNWKSWNIFVTDCFDSEKKKSLINCENSKKYSVIIMS